MHIFSVKFINRTIQGLIIFIFTMNTGAGLYAPFIAVFMNANIKGASLGVVGLLIALTAITKSIVQLPIAKWLDSRAGEKSDYYMMLFGTVITTIYLFGFTIVHSVGWIAFLQIFLGIGEAMIFAAYYAVFAHHIDKESEGFEWSMLSVGGLTMSVAIGSLAGGLIVEKFGFMMLFTTAGLLSILGLILLLLLYPQMNVMRKHAHYKTVAHARRKRVGI